MSEQQETTLEDISYESDVVGRIVAQHELFEIVGNGAGFGDLRRKYGLSVRKVAEYVGANPRTISDFEGGKREIVSMKRSQLERLAEIAYAMRTGMKVQES